MLTVYSDRPAASLKDWLLLDVKSGRLVVVADFDNRADAMWALLSLYGQNKGGFCFPKPKEDCCVKVRV
jgi:hypothetical protein